MSRQSPCYFIILFLLFTVSAVAKTPAVSNQPNVIVSRPVTIRLSGITNPTILENVKKLLKIATAAHLVKPITRASILNIYHNVPSNVRRAMEPYGYFNPNVQSHYRRIHGKWFMHFIVAPGPRSKIVDINIKLLGQGAKNPIFLKAVAAYKKKQGAYFNLSIYNDGNNALLENAENLGYFAAKISYSHMNVNVAKNQVKINVVFNTGARHHFGKTEFSKTPFNRKFLEKYIAYKKGQYYDNKAVQKTQNNYATSDYFTEVVVAPLVNKTAHNKTPMLVKLKMRKRSVYTFGLGYNTDTQLRGLVGFKYRWVNSWGHYINARAQGSFVDYNFSTAYNIPWPNPMKDLFTFRGAMGRLDIRRGKSQSYLLSAIYRHTYHDWVNALSFNYLNERYNMYELPRTRANLYYPDERLSYYSTKNHMNPANGIHLIAEVSGTPSALSSTSGFARFLMGAKAVWSVFKNEQLVGRLSYGRIYIHNINNLPLSLQFLIGGSQTVRGFSYQSIGPGRNMLYGTVEFRQRIWKDLYVGGFYDFGNVTDSRIFGGMRDSAGPTILYRSPIGIIQVSIPWRLSVDHVRPRFVFSIGPEL